MLTVQEDRVFKENLELRSFLTATVLSNVLIHISINKVHMTNRHWRHACFFPYLLKLTIYRQHSTLPRISLNRYKM